MISELDLQGLWKELDAYEGELEKETRTMQDIWVKIAQLKSKNENEAIQLMNRVELDFVHPDTHIGLNVGGQIFETTCGVLTRDPYSILAACCRKRDVPIPQNSDGTFRFDRDWWLFRHILSYLRSNILPNELETLKELYVEASFYRLENLQKAIEEMPLDQVTNLTPQIAVTWPGISDSSPEPGAARNDDNFVLNESLFQATR
jgi:hypothetical protein